MGIFSSSVHLGCSSDIVSSYLHVEATEQCFLISFGLGTVVFVAQAERDLFLSLSDSPDVRRQDEEGHHRSDASDAHAGLLP